MTCCLSPLESSRAGSRVWSPWPRGSSLGPSTAEPHFIRLWEVILQAETAQGTARTQDPHGFGVLVLLSLVLGLRVESLLEARVCKLERGFGGWRLLVTCK